jgi:two-component system CheB/CheR fusion protein
VQIAIVFLTNDLRVRRFTPMAEKILNLIPSDVGRPIGNIRPNIDCPELEQMISEVVDTVATKEREVQDREGHWLLLRIRPYKSIDNRIDGAVLVLLDIDALRRQEEHLRSVQEYVTSVLELVDQPMLVLDRELQVKTANRRFLRAFAPDQPEVVGKSLREVGAGALAAPAIAELVRRTFEASDGKPQEVVESFPALGDRRLRIGVHRIVGPDGRNPAVVLAVREGAPP